MRQEQIAEEARLKKTLDEINRQLQVRYKDKRNFEKNMRETYRNMWEEVEGAPTNLHDLEQLVQAKMYLDEMRNMESAFKGSARKIQYLEKMRDNPYFGRIDFKEDGESEPEQIYIGISTLQNENSLEIFVYDWRAPISSMFYDYEPGKVQYSSPSGTIKGELHLKRQYRIKNGRMEYMFDSDIKIDDDILQEILGQSKDEKMKSIVTTIQREQNRAIRDEEHRLLIVEGPAGSGKTSVALHRIAFLLYRYRNSLNSSNVVIFSPNDMFNDYISEVLPELGEENVRQTTFMEYAKSSLKTKQKVFGLNQQIEFILSNKNSLFYRDIIETIRFKSSLEFLYILKKYIDLLYKNPGKFEDFSVKNKTIISAAEQVDLFNKDFSYLPFIPRLIKIRNRILYQIKQSEGERITELLKQYESHPEWSDLKPVERKKRVTRIVLEEFKPLREKARQIGKIKIIDIYINLFINRDLMKEFVKNQETIANLTTISKITLRQINKKRLYLEDLAPLLYLKGKLNGMPNTASIRHVIIDEAQDYTPVQMQIIRELFTNSSFTVVGDLNQSINPYANIGNMNIFTEIFNFSEKTAHIKMGKSYRSTGEITRFCNYILSPEHNIEFVDRQGSLPYVRIVQDINSCVESLYADIRKIIEQGYHSIAVIGKNIEETKNIYRLLKTVTECRLVVREDAEFTTGVTVITSYLAKGLEFDAALVLNLSNPYQGTAAEQRLFYTVCTRALHRLGIYTMKTLPEYIKNIPQDMYTIVQ